VSGSRLLAALVALAVATFAASGAAPGGGMSALADGLPQLPPLIPTLVKPGDWQDGPVQAQQHIALPESVGSSDVERQLQDLNSLVPDGTATSAPPVIGTSFIGLYDTVGEEPPDTQAAVGPNDIIEMVNSRFQVYSRTGAPLQGGGLRSFFQVPATNEESTDPRVQYDPGSGRFFAVYVSYHNAAGGPGTIHVATSATNSAAGNWNVYAINVTYFTDYPGFGISDDKVVVSTNEYPLPGPGATGIGEQTQILEKADLVAGVTARHTATTQTTGNFTLRPATNLSSGATLWEVDRPSTTQLRIWQVTGSPAAGTATRTLAATLSISSQRTPNQAGVPGGTVDAGDQRILDASWRNGSLWVAATTYCDWGAQDVNGPRACLHLMEVDTSALTLRQDITYGQSTYELMWPAVRTDSAGNLFVVFTRSSETTQPEVRMAGRLATDPLNTLGPSVAIKTGAVNYNGTRWGDYSSAVVDPTDPSVVWLAGEYSRANAGNTFNWGTWIASASFAGVRGSSATQVTVTQTRTGVYCFAYSGPTTQAAGLSTLFTPAVVSMNRFNLPDGDFSSWFRDAPAMATVTQVATGDVLCVSAAPGSAVFH
jgi:hypothetical protein